MGRGVFPTSEQGWCVWQDEHARWRWVAWCRGESKEGASPTPGEAAREAQSAWEELHA